MIILTIISKYKNIKKIMLIDNFIIFNTIEAPDRNFIRFSLKDDSHINYLIKLANIHNVDYRSGNVLTPFFEILLTENKKKEITAFLNELLEHDYDNYSEYKNNLKLYEDDLLEFDKVFEDFLSLIPSDDTKNYVKAVNKTNFKGLYKSPKAQHTRALKRLDKFYQ